MSILNNCFSSTHERKTKTDVIVKHEKYYLKQNSFTEVWNLVSIEIFTIDFELAFLIPKTYMHIKTLTKPFLMKKLISFLNKILNALTVHLDSTIS